MKLLDSFVRSHSLSSSAAPSSSSLYSKKHHFKYALFPCINSTCCRLYLHNAHKNVFHSFTVLIADATLNYRHRRVCTIVNGTMMPVRITLVLMMNTHNDTFSICTWLLLWYLSDFKHLHNFTHAQVYKCTYRQLMILTFMSTQCPQLLQWNGS